jgi:hypothetical protein
MALYGLGGLEFRGLHHESLHRYRLALQGLSPVLDLEDSRRETWAPKRAEASELMRTMSRENPLW